MLKSELLLSREFMNYYRLAEASPRPLGLAHDLITS
jgi:hypothetical protein